MAADLAARMIKFRCEVGEEAEVHSDARHDAAPMGPQQGAVVASLDPGQLLGPGVDPVRDPAKHLSSFVSRHGCPAGKGLLSGAYRGVRLYRGSGRDFGDRLLVDGGDIGESRLRRDALAADPVSSVHLHALDRRSRHPRPCQLLEVVRGSSGG